ncbi:hypothetical protein OIV83_000279 [Microbotryomycetes sp. JL201]|nr:hypothetical protein OIV83_000279 [Microbotryomycetes sp. JL201]
MSAARSRNPTSLYNVPIRDRPRPSFVAQAGLLLFYSVFLALILVLHAFQLVVCLPLSLLLPKRVYRGLIAHTKDAFGAVLLLIVQGFGPSELHLTAGRGIDLDRVCKIDKDGNVVGFNFDKQADLGSGIIIILKASLRWAPIAMQLFQFIFVDKKHALQEGGLLQVAENAVAWNRPFQLLLFPEGTLVSRLTRPKSASFAKTSAIEDLKNTLLPRSTGLLYCLRTLSLAMPDLSVYDLTIGYDGVPAAGYAQDYFTLKTIFGLRTPPPRVHLHLRRYDVRDVPIGQVRPDRTAVQLERDVTEQERTAFQQWTLDKWREKDKFMQSFYETGSFQKVSKEEAASGVAKVSDHGAVATRVVRVRMRGKDVARIVSTVLGLAIWVRAIRWLLSPL